MDVDNDTAKWVGGLLWTATVAGIGGLWKHLTGRIDAVERAAKKENDDLWSVINAERDSSSRFRVDITQSVAKLPTRDEFERRLGDVARDIKDFIRGHKD